MERLTPSPATRARRPDRVRVIALPECGGKAAALERGVAAARGKITTADARQRLPSGAVSQLVRSFVDPEVGAAAGNWSCSIPRGRPSRASASLAGGRPTPGTDRRFGEYRSRLAPPAPSRRRFVAALTGCRGGARPARVRHQAGAAARVSSCWAQAAARRPSGGDRLRRRPSCSAIAPTSSIAATASLGSSPWLVCRYHQSARFSLRTSIRITMPTTGNLLMFAWIAGLTAPIDTHADRRRSKK